MFSEGPLAFMLHIYSRYMPWESREAVFAVHYIHSMCVTVIDNYEHVQIHDALHCLDYITTLIEGTYY